MERGETPFIHCIETPLGHYVFDVNTNRFLSMEEPGLYQTIQGMENGREPSPAYTKEIDSLKKRGFLSSRRPTTLEHGMTYILQDQLQNNIEQITLQLTQQCNFRCAYCVYAPKDFHYQREHSSKRMTWETAKAAVDFAIFPG